MEEQNQEKATATQHVTVADAAAPETGNGKKEDKGGGKKEKKTAKPLTPKQLQQRKKLMVYPLMGLLFLGSMWLIFAPSEERDVNRDTVGAFNADIPLPENDGIIGDKRKAYEQAQAERRQAEKVRSLEVFAFSEREPQAYWLAKAFILLGDVYVRKGDNFQARATYQSVADGYSPADDGIVDEAKARIAKLN